MTEPAVGASTWASGSQVWNGHIGSLTANDANKASQSQVCTAGAHTSFIKAGISVVPACKYMNRMASKNSTEPSNV